MQADLYGVHLWGNEYFTILPNGHIGLRNPLNDESSPTDLVEVIKSLNERGICSPLLLRVEEFLVHRLQVINQTFKTAMDHSLYQGQYRGVFPIKVNQQAQVVQKVRHCFLRTIVFRIQTCGF